MDRGYVLSKQVMNKMDKRHSLRGKGSNGGEVMRRSGEVIGDPGSKAEDYLPVYLRKRCIHSCYPCVVNNSPWPASKVEIHSAEYAGDSLHRATLQLIIKS